MPQIVLSDPQTVPAAGIRYVSLRLLWDCNIRCVMCDHPHKAQSVMAPETAHRVLDQLDHPVRITFIGGEPCLWLLRHPDVLRRAFDDGHVVHMISNGILVPRLTDFVDAFDEKAVSIQFSIDGVEATYERIRKLSRWQSVVDSIRLLHSRRARSGNRRAFITTSYLLMRDTLEDLPKFVHFCADEGIDSIFLTYATIYQTMVDRGEITHDDSVYFHQDETNAAVERAFDAARLRGIPISAPPPLGGTVFGRRWVGPETSSVAPGPPFVPAVPVACDKPWKEIFVNQDGAIVPCCCGPLIGPTIGVLDHGLETVWNSDIAQRVRGNLVAGSFDPLCRCGINISSVGRQASKEDFFRSW